MMMGGTADLLPGFGQLAQLRAGGGEVDAGDLELGIADDHGRPDAEGTTCGLRNGRALIKRKPGADRIAPAAAPPPRFSLAW